MTNFGLVLTRMTQFLLNDFQVILLKTKLCMRFTLVYYLYVNSEVCYRWFILIIIGKKLKVYKWFTLHDFLAKKYDNHLQ